MTEAVKILIIEESESECQAYRKFLEKDCDHMFEITEAMTADDGVKYCEENKFDCLLLDAKLIEKQTTEYVDQLLETQSYPAVLLLTDHENEHLAAQALKNVAQDYILKDHMSLERLSTVITNALQKIELLQTIKKQNDELLKLAHYDSLTGLLNRFSFEESSERAIAHAKRHENFLAILFIDLDNFKNVNDSLGHHAGNDLLKTVSERIKGCVRKNDILARIGGDEFAITLTHINNHFDAGRVAKKILEELKTPINIEGHDLYVGASIGISCFPFAAESFEELEKCADIAMYRAKDLGKNNYQYYTLELNNKHLERLDLETDMHTALQNDEFYIKYQPIFDLKTMKIVAIETWLHWDHAMHHEMPSSEILAIAEEIGMIKDLGNWIMDTACREYTNWRHNDIVHCPLAINVSPRQFTSNYSDDIMSNLEIYNLKPHDLILELTETTIMEHNKLIDKTLVQLQQLGLKLVIDDFGMHCLSLTHLASLPIHELKIDSMFIKMYNMNKINNAIIKSIIDFAKNLELSVIADGVSKEEQLEFLKAHGCNFAQGLFFCEPLPADAFKEFIQQKDC